MGFRRLFFDIETSPMILYSWNIGKKVYLTPDNIIKEGAIICICWKWQDDEHIYSLRWDNGNDAEMLREFVEVANEADEIVAHNGDNFDIKWLRTQCLKYRIPCFPDYRTIDTLKWSRSGFRFASNKLDYISKFLGGEGKTKVDYNLWKKVMAGDNEALEEMVEYCENDVLELQNVFEVLSQYTMPKTNIAILEGGERWHCPHCASDNVHKSKTRSTAAGIIRHQMRCGDCTRYFTISNTLYERMQDDEEV